MKNGTWLMVEVNRTSEYRLVISQSSLWQSVIHIRHVGELPQKRIQMIIKSCTIDTELFRIRN